MSIKLGHVLSAGLFVAGSTLLYLGGDISTVQGTILGYPGIVMMGAAVLVAVGT